MNTSVNKWRWYSYESRTVSEREERNFSSSFWSTLNNSPPLANYLQLVPPCWMKQQETGGPTKRGILRHKQIYILATCSGRFLKLPILVVACLVWPAEIWSQLTENSFFCFRNYLLLHNRPIRSKVAPSRIFFHPYVSSSL